MVALKTLHAMLSYRVSPSKYTPLIKRHISGASSKHEARMRSLVSLYHQCDSFITPENLSQKIDEAFVPQNKIASYTTDVEKRSYAELRRLAAQKDEEPRHFFGKGGKPSTNTGLKEVLSSSSPNTEQQRIARAREALVGMGGDGRPLWTAVKRDAWRIRTQLKEDKRQGI